MDTKIPTLKISQILFFSIIIFALVLPQVIHGKDTGLKDVAPDGEKRSCIQSVDGYAYLSEDMTLSETRKVAFANAKRQAVENAKTFIISNTVVEDFVVKKDIIKGTAEGAVTILEQKDFGVEDNQRYHVWIKAEVEYGLKQKKQKIITDTAFNKEAPLTVKVWTPKKKYKAGENIVIYIQGNREYYARIVDITSRGEIIQLLPNDYRTINFFEAGKVYKIPDKGDHFNLKVSPPYGEDQIVVYASEVPLGTVSMEQAGQGLRSFKGTRKSLAVKTRGVAIVPEAQNVGSGVQFFEGSWTLRTEK
jgi:hypothetical protein